MNTLSFKRGFLLFLLLYTTRLLQAQEMSNASFDSTTQLAPPVPRVSYSLSAGAAFNNFGSASYLEPRVQYRVTPRVHVFSSLAIIQNWGSPAIISTTAESKRPTAMIAPNRHYLLHVGGSYAMSERLLLSGSVWKDLSPSSVATRWNNNPFMNGRLPQQGFQFQAHYQVTPHVTISGAVRYNNGGTGYWNSPGAYYNGDFGLPAAGLHGPF